MADTFDDFDFFADLEADDAGDTASSVETVNKETHLDLTVKEQEDIKTRFNIDFSDEQLAVVSYDSSDPLVVASCAGSGKTTTIISNILYRIFYKGVNPSKVLAITFSKKASDDMGERYTELVQKVNVDHLRLGKPHFSTFHSLFYQLIRSYGNRNTQVLDINQFRNRLFRYIHTTGGKSKADVLTDMISYRSKMINTCASLDGMVNVTIDEEELGFKGAEYFEVLKQYELIKQEQGVIDFEDMQVKVLDLLKSEVGARMRENFREGFDHIYMDEFQDISPLQMNIMSELLDGSMEDVIVIGDGDQCIYRFRGSAPQYIHNFKYAYAGAQALTLSTNYRCGEYILDDIIPSIKRNSNRDTKQMLAGNKGVGTVKFMADRAVDYSNFINTLKTNFADYELQEYSEVAILVRNNIQRTILSDILAENNIPINIGNLNYSLRNNRFYETFIDLVQMVKQRDNELFKKYYRQVIPQLGASVAEKYDQMKSVNNDWFKDIVEDDLYNTNQEVRDNLKKIGVSDNTAELFMLVGNLLQGFFRKLEDQKKSYIVDHYVEVLEYLKSISGEDLPFDTFLQGEATKERKLDQWNHLHYGIQILTLHTSKGLEFDTVILYGMNSDVIPNRGALSHLVQKGKYAEAEAQFEEERRLFYVGWTRAKRVLIVEALQNKPSIFLSEVKHLAGIKYREKTSLADALTESASKLYRRHLELQVNDRQK